MVSKVAKWKLVGMQSGGLTLWVPFQPSLWLSSLSAMVFPSQRVRSEVVLLNQLYTCVEEGHRFLPMPV